MEQFIPEKEAARRLPDIIDDLTEQGSRLVIERQGHPVAVLVGVGDYAEFLQREHDVASAAGQTHGAVLGEDVSAWLAVERLELRLGMGLLSLFDPQAGEELLARLRAVRQGLALRLGIVAPSVRVRDDMEIPSNIYCVSIREREVFRWPIYVRHILLAGPKFPPEAFSGVQVTDPFHRRPAYWLPDSGAALPEDPACHIHRPIDVITRQFYQMALIRAHEILSREDVHILLRHLEIREPALVAEVVPGVLEVAQLHHILKRLLSEQVCIRDLSRILEVVSDHAFLASDIEEMVVVLRADMGETVCSPYLDGSRNLPALTVSPSLDHRLQGVLFDPRSPADIGSPVEAAFLETLETQMFRLYAADIEPVILCSNILRPFLRRFLASRFPTLPVIAHNEVPENVTVQPIENVALP
ncbi:MAG: FHIPEP family type III secretion protein [Armatimonadetes bacterium]|nr:FHIPEP family type III secretion protein [Armatimonadota bacterium]